MRAWVIGRVNQEALRVRDRLRPSVPRNQELRQTIQRRRVVRTYLQGGFKFLFRTCILLLNRVDRSQINHWQGVIGSQSLGAGKLLACGGKLLAAQEST